MSLDKSMNILYVINSGNPGGLEQHMLDLVRGMVARGNSVHMWCASGEIVDWYKQAGAKVTQRSIHGELDFSYIFSLKKYIKENNITVVHTGELKAGINALIAAVLAGVPVKITHIHTPMSEWPAENTLKKFYRKLEISFYSFLVNNFATYEIALTESRKAIKIKEWIKENKLKVIPNALDTSRLDFNADTRLQFRKELCAKYQIPDDAVIFGNISRLTVEKGHEILVNAFALFLKNNSIQAKNSYLFLAGGGTLEGHLRKLTQELGIESNVKISGVFDAKDWAKYYSLFDVYVFPSLAEGFGLVLIEGMYMGIPVICSDLPVLKEVACDTVTYFKTGDSRDLETKLSAVAVQNNVIDRWKDTPAKSRVMEKYSMEVFILSYQQLYEGFNNR